MSIEHNIMNNKTNQKGFTLIEIAIVIVVIGFLLGGLLSSVGVQRQQIRRDQTRELLGLIKTGLIGFAVTNGRLPCPDTDAEGTQFYGQENPVGGPNAGNSCDSEWGTLPFFDIEVGQQDAWGNAFHYRVNDGSTGGINFADNNAGAASFTLLPADVGVISVQNGIGAGTFVIANQLPAVVVSFGENGREVYSGVFPCIGYSVNETANCDVDQIFVRTEFSTAPGNGYDDLVEWLPLTVLKAKMVDAGWLP